LDDEFLKYCELNNVKDVDKLARQTFNRGFAILKYGESPLGVAPEPTPTKIEKVKKQKPVKEIIQPTATPIPTKKVKEETDLYDE